VTPPRSVTIQVVPLAAGPHPSQGTYEIFDVDFGAADDNGICPAGVFVESPIS
jgi:hypothetical protein